MAKSLTQLFQQSQFERMVVRSKQLASLNRHLETHLPAPLAQHCHIANYRDNELVLVADNATWATRLRYLAPDLITALQKTPVFKGLKNVHCRVAQPSASSPASATQTDAPISRHISTQSAEILKATADSVSDEKLSESLLRLSQRCRS